MIRQEAVLTAGSAKDFISRVDRLYIAVLAWIVRPIHSRTFSKLLTKIVNGSPTIDGALCCQASESGACVSAACCCAVLLTWARSIDREKFAAKLGPEEFADVLRQHGGPGAQEEFDALMARMKPLSNAAQGIPNSFC